MEIGHPRSVEIFYISQMSIHICHILYIFCHVVAMPWTMFYIFLLWLKIGGKSEIKLLTIRSSQISFSFFLSSPLPSPPFQEAKHLIRERLILFLRCRIYNLAGIDRGHGFFNFISQFYIYIYTHTHTHTHIYIYI